MGHCCIIAPHGCLWGWEKVLVGGTEAGFFFWNSCLCVICIFPWKLVLELGVVIKAIEQAANQRCSSSSPHAGGSLTSSKTLGRITMGSWFKSKQLFVEVMLKMGLLSLI